jgi:hypothetical protein
MSVGDCTAIYLTGCALLVSAYLHGSTQGGLSVYHALIVLNLSWLNNVSASLSLNYETSITPYVLRWLSRGPERDEYPIPRILSKELAACLLHFTLMAAFGLWVFTDILTFDTSQPNCTSSTVYYIFGHDVSITNKQFRTFWLVIYSYSIIPGLNILSISLGISLPFLILFHYNQAYRPRWRYSVLALTISIPVFLDIIIILSTEGMIARNAVTADEHQWTFGQTLAVLLLIFPAMNLWKDAKVFLEKRRRWLMKDEDSLQRTDHLLADTNVSFHIKRIEGKLMMYLTERQ